ncbi:DegQ family serine endoprotease [bacterium]|nr:DegQ family serine endoprotease [bacterium]
MTEISKRTWLPFFLIAPFLLTPVSAHAEESDSYRGQAQALSRAFEEVAETITPALVNIRAVSRPGAEQTRAPNRGPRLNRRGRPLPLPPGLPESFRDFFERFGEGAPGEEGGRGVPPQRGLGSGVLVDKDGHILTNNHVVANADEVTVRLSDGRTFEASIVGTDPRTDLAVIRIEAENITPAELGSSEELKIGEWVVAAGTPFGLENTITAGIVSAKGRSIIGGNAYEDFIQTDAAINPGNSGGPLANLDGEVVGINTAIFSRSGGYMGVGFAIPIDLAKSIMSSLISDGKVIRGWLGVVIQELDEDLAESFGYTGKTGALVSALAEEGPAEKGGIQQGDIIVAFNGKEVEDVNDLRNMVAAEKPNSRITLGVLREGKKKELRIVLGELPNRLESPLTLEPEEEVVQPNYASEIGITVEPLTEELRAQAQIQSKGGVVVSSVQPGSLAAEKGMRVGDLVKKVGERKTDSLESFEKAMKKADLGEGVRLLVESRGIDRFLFLKNR